MIVGFTFTKINVERMNPIKGKVSISNSIDLTSLKEQPYALKSKQKALNVSFTYTVDYKEHIGSINLAGEVIYLVDEKRQKQIFNLWKTKKKIPPEESMVILNTVLNKCIVKTLELSQTLKLPPHIPLPKVDFDKQNVADSYIG